MDEKNKKNKIDEETIKVDGETIAVEPTEILTGNSDKGIYIHKFKKPFEYEGKEYETITFCFNKLKGRDMIAIENEMQSLNEYVLAPEISSSFLCKMAARSANIGSDIIENLPMADFSKIKNVARDFLISAGF